MSRIIAECSFLATIKCQNAGFEGYWDRHQIERHSNGVDGVRCLSNYLTINNFCNQPGVDKAERCQFAFRCHLLGDGSPAYQIFVAAGDENMQLDMTETLDYLHFYPDAQSRAMWRIYFDGVVAVPGEVGKYSGFSLRPVIEKRWTWTGVADRSRFRLTPKARKDDGQYWTAFIQGNTAVRSGELVGDLNVLSIG
ncbi:hypothetical protein [Pseudomonas sp. dw_358]|uniref:hypothetical protein n=1 Tax=Pseudomonas sp. dw_358 TaxID=2720083 RepID=UPI001BD58D94|nr:hypothetical protein [Pseudomonas sp. dw_358]